MSQPIDGIENIPPHAVGCMRALCAEVSRAGLVPCVVLYTIWSRYMRDVQETRGHVLVWARDRLDVWETFCTYPDDTADQIAEEVREVIDQYRVYDAD